LPYILDMGRQGIEATIETNADLRGAVLIWEGKVVDPTIAQEAGLPYTSLSAALSA